MNFPSIKTFDSGSKRNKRYLHNHYPEFEEYLSVHFNFVDKWSEKLYCYYHNIHSHPTCSMCGGFLRFINFNKGYNKYCSIKCSSNSIATINKRKKTCLEKYGVEYASQSKKFRNNFKQTCLEKYGVENPFQSKDVQNKYKQTCLEKYGVENYNQSQEYQSRHDEIQTKFKQTSLNKYGVEHYNKSEKGRTILSSILSSEEVRNKIKQTCLERYGVENPSQSEEIQNKTKQTCLEKYGSEYYAQSQDYQSRQKDILNRYKQTCLERYGVEYYNQSEDGRARLSEKISSDEIQTKMNNTKHLNHTFSSSQIETEFASYLDSQNIEYKRQYRSKVYPFNCDFYLPKYDLYIEIQASWTHGGHPYNEESDKTILEAWKSKNTDYYDNAIETWTKRDVRKREIARQNQLNYLEIFSDDINEILNTMFKHLL